MRFDVTTVLAPVASLVLLVVACQQFKFYTFTMTLCEEVVDE
jgi:hypothetical protein